MAREYMWHWETRVWKMPHRLPRIGVTAVGCNAPNSSQSYPLRTTTPTHR